jgi:hypothetical protein
VRVAIPWPLRPNPCGYARRRVRELDGDLHFPRRRRCRFRAGRGQRRFRPPDRRARGHGLRLARRRHHRLLSRTRRPPGLRRSARRGPRASVALAQRGHGRDRRPLDHLRRAANRHLRHHRSPHRRPARHGRPHRRVRAVRLGADSVERRPPHRPAPSGRRSATRPEALTREAVCVSHAQSPILYARGSGYEVAPVRGTQTRSSRRGRAAARACPSERSRSRSRERRRR